MAAYRRVYDSRHLQLTDKKRDQPRNATLGNRVWATFTFLQRQERCRINKNLKNGVIGKNLVVVFKLKAADWHK